VFRDLLGLTGTPCVGKKTLAPLIAQSLGVKAFGMTELAFSEGLVHRRVGEVDPGLLRKAISKRVPAGSLVYGHLLPYVLRKGEARMVCVLRCDPSVLKKRLRARRYRESKVNENVEAELIGLLAFESRERFGVPTVFDVDTTNASISASAKAVTRRFRSMRPSELVDWLPAYSRPGRLGDLFTGGFV
jgi:adenylate kinase